jgi:hypothetical protein
MDARALRGLFTICLFIPTLAWSEDAVSARAARTSPTLSATDSAAKVSTLKVESEPAGARLYINDSLAGETPYEKSALPPGSYEFRVEKAGYRPQSYRLNAVSGKDYELRFTLSRALSTLRLSVSPSQAVATLDGKRALPGEHSLSAGSHALRVELFGYNSFEKDLRLADQSDQEVAVSLEKAAFSVSGLKLAQPSFNPLDRGWSGKAALSFRVSAPGVGAATVRDSEGTIVLEFALGPFKDWEQTFTWDGRDAAGRLAADGLYSITIAARGDDGGEFSRSVPVSVDSSQRVSGSNEASGASGYYCAATALVLPAGVMEVTASAALTVNYSLDGSALPFWLSCKIGLPAHIEAGATVYGALLAGSATDFAFAAYAKWRYLAQPLPLLPGARISGGVYLGADYSIAGDSDFYALAALGSGGRLGAPLTFDWEWLTLSLSPIAGFGVSADAAVRAYFGGAAGMGARVSNLDLGISGEWLYSPSLSGTEQLEPRAAVEARYTEPRSLFFGQAGAELDFASTGALNLKALISFGIIF